MIVPDVNLLVYAYKEGMAEHTPARRWWENLINGREEVGIPWLVAIGFVRIMANPRAVTNPLHPSEAIAIVREWFDYGHIQPLNPGARHLELLQDILNTDTSVASVAAANRAPDAHIAALALEHNGEVHTNDTDFGRFPGLQWRNPLPPSPGR